MYNFVNCLQFNIRYEKVERLAPMGGALVQYMMKRETTLTIVSMQALRLKLNKKYPYTVKPVYKGHSREPENVTFMNSCPLYTG